MLIAYYRVSTQRQGESGLGLDAQRAAVGDYARRIGASIATEYTEVESGRKANRPQLATALADARTRGATLVVAKLDRLSRDVRFLLDLVDSRVGLLFLDLPELDTRTAIGRMVLVIMANLAEFESRRTGERIREALARRKKKPKARRFSRAHQRRASAAWHALDREAAEEFRAEFRPLALGLRQSMTLAEVADEMNRRGIPTRRRKKWTPGLVWALLKPQARAARR